MLGQRGKIIYIPKTTKDNSPKLSTWIMSPSHTRKMNEEDKRKSNKEFLTKHYLDQYWDLRPGFLNFFFIDLIFLKGKQEFQWME